MSEKKISEKSSKEVKEQKPEDLRSMIEKNIKWSQVIYNQNKKIKNKLTMMAVLAWLKFFLILAPLIAGIIFLPPLFDQLFEQYGQLLGGGGVAEVGSIIEELGSENIAEVLKMLKGN